MIRTKALGREPISSRHFFGVALGLRGGTKLIPLVQQFLSYSGEDVNTTALRLIALQSLPEQMWFKLDAKISEDK